jgi:hypothetical protein
MSLGWRNQARAVVHLLIGRIGRAAIVRASVKGPFEISSIKDGRPPTYLLLSKWNHSTELVSSRRKGMINKIALAFVSPHSDFWEAPSFNGGNVRMKKSNPCDGLEPGLYGFKHGG